MDKNKFTSPIREEVLSLFEQVDVTTERCFDSEKLKNLMSIAEIFDVRKIIVTGAGDSWVAGGAMLPVMEKYCDAMSVQVYNPIQFSRFVTKGDIGIGEPNSPLIIGISVGGGTARVAEVLEKANALGACSMLITNNPESRCAKIAKKVFDVETPAFPYDKMPHPNIRSYFASLTALAAVSCRFGHVRGLLPPTAKEEFKKAIKDYVESWKPVFDDIDEQMFDLAKTWCRFEKFDFLGVETQLYSTIFGLEKFYESCGTLCNYDDPEDWCHIDYLCKDPETIGTIFHIDKDSPSLSRTIETINSAVHIGRPTLVVTNSDAEFPEGAVVCRIPKAPEGYEWVTPMMEYIPDALLAGYCATLGGRKNFVQYDPMTKEFDMESLHSRKGAMTIGTSEVQIHV
ncbi:MAG: hypothetical protein IKE27_04730 [Oscillospiraceae bacterium]|nr:hypothetical protein [Oscillospiraceae bacterium]